MALENIRVPLYNSGGKDEERKMIVKEFAGRMKITIIDKERQIDIEFYFGDLKRAWEAVKQ